MITVGLFEAWVLVRVPPDGFKMDKSLGLLADEGFGELISLTLPGERRSPLPLLPLPPPRLAFLPLLLLLLDIFDQDLS